VSLPKATRWQRIKDALGEEWTYGGHHRFCGCDGCWTYGRVQVHGMGMAEHLELHRIGYYGDHFPCYCGAKLGHRWWGAPLKAAFVMLLFAGWVWGFIWSLR
jgi:hypothetical protein